MFAYCNNNPVSYEDSSGCLCVPCAFADDGRGGYDDYVIYYFHPESSQNLEEPAMNNHEVPDSNFIGVSGFDEFVAAINDIPENVNDVYIYMHSDEANFSFYYAQYYSAEDIGKSLNEVDISGEIYLFSCKGGRGKLASTMASTTGCTVVASVYKVSFGTDLARCGWENYLWDVWEYGVYSWYSFYPDGSNEPLTYFSIPTQ